MRHFVNGENLLLRQSLHVRDVHKELFKLLLNKILDLLSHVLNLLGEFGRTTLDLLANLLQSLLDLLRIRYAKL